jgi:hypothetical protein
LLPQTIYRVIIKCFPNYEHFLQENYVEYKLFFLSFLLMFCKKKLLELSYIWKKKVCIPRSFLIINFCNQGKTLCSPCAFWSTDHEAPPYVIYFILFLLRPS